MSLLATRLKKAGVGKPKKRELVWSGPESIADNGGITQSRLSGFLGCRERFRLRVVEGLAPVDAFNHRKQYGQMWHTCEEAHAKNNSWKPVLEGYCKGLCTQYPLQQEQIVHWMNVCKVQFPIYVDYWAKHPDVKQRTPLLQEQVFRVPYMLPSGRTVYLRGKWDSVDLIGKGKNAGIYLTENKTKGDIDEQQIQRRLLFDLQTMIYSIAFRTQYKGFDGHKFCGIRYNVVRRPLSGGKGSIKQKQGSRNVAPETSEEFYQRLANDYLKAEPEYWFMRWKVKVINQDIERFKQEFLNPCLEQLCDWWGWVSSPVGLKDPFADSIHFRLPYGVYNPLLEGNSTEVDEYLNSGSMVGLQYNSELFGELR